MFELPELFGSPYILPAIIVVVILLLLLLLLLLSSRRKKRARAIDEASRPAESKAAALLAGLTPDQVPEETPAAPAPSRAKSIPAGQAHAEVGVGGVPSTDPIKAALGNILEGWGDLTAEDTNRLQIFRTDKVLAAIAALELPKDLKSNEYARSRLNQLRHYATSLQEGRQEVHGPHAEPAGIGLGPLSQAGWASTVEAGAAATETELQIDGGVEAAETMAEAGEEISDAEETAGEERAAEYSWGVQTSKEPWGTEAALALSATTEIPVVEETVVAEDAVEAEELPAVEEVTGFEEVTGAGGATVADDSISSMWEKISTADDLMALPAAEQADMLVFLKPAELGEVFQASKDPELKKSVIDTLEHIGGPTSLDLIHQCLDDPDPEVVMHALDAADRLLGVH